MSMRFYSDLPRCTQALCEAVVANLNGRKTPDTAAVSRVTAYVLAQQARMPDFLRWPLKILTRAFAVMNALSVRKAFHHWPLEDRIQAVEAWRKGRFKFQRDLIRFYESLAIFAWHSIQEEAAQAKTTQAEASQDG